jgi:CYTH domain-containing protein
MPIENEWKFVLENDGELEPRLAQAPGVTRGLIVQAYLDTPGVRLRVVELGGKRHHIFTYKRPIDGEVVEIETYISADDFQRLWKLRKETLQKVRYSWPDGHFGWDVDFFKAADGSTYFAMAEVEMPAGDLRPPPPPPRLAPHVIFAVPYGDSRFTSKRLADRAHAEALLAEIRQKKGEAA